MPNEERRRRGLQLVRGVVSLCAGVCLALAVSCEREAAPDGAEPGSAEGDGSEGDGSEGDGAMPNAEPPAPRLVREGRFVFSTMEGQGPLPATHTQSEWEAATEPQWVEHSVSGVACDSGLLPGDHALRPTVSCAVRRDERSIRDCLLESTCRGDADCAERPFGRCTGQTSALCEYEGMRAPCESEGDCTLAPGGRCVGSIESDVLYCYPTGECTRDRRNCDYPSLTEQGCESDSDCVALPGGRCSRVIQYVRCTYDECSSDGDCSPTEGCVCSGGRVCIPRACRDDAECGAGQSCRQARACYSPLGVYCTTTEDECRQDSDCGSGWCTFEPAAGHWVCGDPNGCPTIP